MLTILDIDIGQLIGFFQIHSTLNGCTCSECCNCNENVFLLSERIARDNPLHKILRAVEKFFQSFDISVLDIFHHFFFVKICIMIFLIFFELHDFFCVNTGYLICLAQSFQLEMLTDRDYFIIDAEV